MHIGLRHRKNRQIAWLGSNGIICRAFQEEMPYVLHHVVVETRADKSKQLCVHKMFNLRTLILQGEVQAGQVHPDLPRLQHSLRSWWLMGTSANLSCDDF